MEGWLTGTRGLWACASNVAEWATKQPSASTRTTEPLQIDLTGIGYERAQNPGPMAHEGTLTVHQSAAQPSLAQVTENPPMTSEDVDPITGIFGADKTGPTTDISTPQITEITSTCPNTSKPDSTEMDHTPTHLCQP